MSKDKDRRPIPIASVKHVDHPAAARPADASSLTSPKTNAPLEAPGRGATIETSRPTAVSIAATKIQCSTCTFGQDLKLGGGQRRCRALPPQAHYLSRHYGDGPESGALAIAMWPVVADTDACGIWQSYDVS